MAQCNAGPRSGASMGLAVVGSGDEVRVDGGGTSGSTVDGRH